MNAGALTLVDHVLPAVPLRQFVLTLPFSLRFPLSFDGKLLGQVLRIFIDTVASNYRRRLADRGIAAKSARTGARCRYWPWAELMRLTLGLPVDTCPNCGGRMNLRALVRDPESIERFLRHQGLWTEPLGLAEARPPPYFRSITRLRPNRQTELFE